MVEINNQISVNSELFNLNFYKEPPDGLETFEHLQEFIEKRLDLYSILINTQDDNEENQRKLIEKQTIFGNLLKSREIQRIDNISHWLLRLGCSNSFVTRNLFVKLEKLWFQYRLKQFTIDGLVEISQKLLKLSPISGEDARYFRVKFTQVPELVKKRLYILKNGYIYIPDYELATLLTNKFVENLEKSIIHVSKILPTIQSDQLDLLLSTIQLIDDNCRDFDESEYSGLVNLVNIDEYSKHFPLCMRHLHENLRNTHHLKYFGRMQYGLFIKGLGFRIDETLQLFHDEFVKTMPEIKFEKKYSYLFRHHYGLVGSKSNQRPYSCKKIFEINVNPNEIHGCPFKHWSSGELLKKLEGNGFDLWQINEIVSLKEKKFYQQACGRYFEFSNKTKLEGNIDSPNQYFFNCCSVRGLQRDILSDSSDVDIEDLVLD